MGAIKANSRSLLLVVAALLALSSSGCSIMTSYALRPGHWFVHNAFPSTCKTCPGGMPGPDGCRSFMDPWCAGYQNTMWRDLGSDCGPSRLPSALALDDQQQPTVADGPGTAGEAGDRAPDLPDNFVSPLPEPGQLSSPLPELPLDGSGAPADNPFPVRPVPSTPPNDAAGNPLRESVDDQPPIAPDVFPESRPNTRTLPPPRTPVAAPESIDDLFTPPTTDPPSKTAPSTLPPARSPVTPLPNFDEPAAPKAKEAAPDSKTKPAPKSTVPFGETPSLEDTPDLFPDNEKPASPKGNEPATKVPNLFDDSSYPPNNQTPESQAYVKFGMVLPTSAVQDSAMRVQLAGATSEYPETLHAPRRIVPAPPQSILRIVPR